MRILIALCLAVISAPVAASPSPNWAAQRLQAAVTAYQNEDYRVARHYFRRLAIHGSAIAETMLGVMYANGNGVRANQATAAGYFFRAAGRGYGPAQIALADAFAAGRGVAPDAGEAYFWARLAAMGRDAVAKPQGEARAAQLLPLLGPGTIERQERRVRQWRPRAVRRR